MTNAQPITEADLDALLEDDPGLLRAIRDLTRTPYFRNVKRWVVGAFQEEGEERAQLVASAIAYAIRDTVLDFGPDGV